MLSNSATPKKGRITRRSTLINNTSFNLTPIRTRKSVAASIDTGSPTPVSIRSDPKTPKKPIEEPTPKTKYVDRILGRIQKDLNSPSANSRVRANRALKDPEFRARNYGQFDIPYERQDLITDEERKPVKPKTIEEIFANVKIYVEVRTGDDNRSAGIKNHLLRNGITVNEKLYKDTTHVIFKDGLLSTYKNAKKLGIPVTTILWADDCLSQKRLIDPEKYKISNLDRYEHPELYKRIRREKSMQPEISKIVNPHFFPTDKPMSHEDSRKNYIGNESLVTEGAKTPNQARKSRRVTTFTPRPMEETKKEFVDETSIGMEITFQGEKTLCEADEAIEIDATITDDTKTANRSRRFTTFTPQRMEQTEIAGNSPIDHCKKFFASQVSKESTGFLTPDGNGFSSNSRNTIVFNSSNRISKNSRRSVFDISMNILDLNCKALSQKKNETLVSPKKFVQSSDSKPCETHTQVNKTGIVRKRKLFNNDTDEIDDIKENLNKSVGINNAKKIKTVAPAFNTPQLNKKSKPILDRRRTLSYFKSEKTKEAVLKPKTPVKPSIEQKYVVCTNMSSNDKRIISAAIEELGGKLEMEVSSKTTHVVSPNDDRTMNILRGVIRACVIVNVSWIHDSLAKGEWLDTLIYQRSICDANRVYERSIIGTKNYKNFSFANRGRFFLRNESIDDSKKVNYLKEVIELCGGEVTEKKAEAHYIVSDQPVTNKTDSQVDVNSTYIFDSAMKGKLLDVVRFYKPKLE